MRKISILLCSLLLFFMWAIPKEGQAAVSSMSLVVNGKKVKPDVPPQLINKRTMVPVYFVGDAYGVKVTWEGKTSTVTIDNHTGKVIKMWLGQKTAYINGKAFTLEQAPLIVKERTFLPLRQVGELLGATIGWDSDSNTVIVNNKKSIAVNEQTLSQASVYQLPYGNFVKISELAKPLGYEVKQWAGKVILEQGTEKYIISKASPSQSDGYRLIDGQFAPTPEFLAQIIKGKSHWDEEKTVYSLDKLQYISDISLNEDSISIKTEGKADIPTSVPTPEPTSSPQPGSNGKYVVVVDAGHGGKDVGAIGTHGNKEKDLTLAIASKLETELKKKADFTVVMTRTSDLDEKLTQQKRKQELSEKVSIANSLHANLFVSVHINSATPAAHGTETFYTTTKSKEFAQIMHKHLLKATGFTDRGLKTTERLYVTRNTKMPSTLVEIGFLSNQAENDKMLDPTFQQRVAEELAAGVEEYYNKHH